MTDTAQLATPAVKVTLAANIKQPDSARHSLFDLSMPLHLTFATSQANIVVPALNRAGAEPLIKDAQGFDDENRPTYPLFFSSKEKMTEFLNNLQSEGITFTADSQITAIKQEADKICKLRDAVKGLSENKGAVRA